MVYCITPKQLINIHQPTGQLIAHPHPSTPIQRLRHHLRAPLAAASVSLHAWHFDDPNEVMKLAEIGAFRFFFWDIDCKGVKGVIKTIHQIPFLEA